MQKVSLYRAMQFHYAQLDIEDKHFYENLRTELVSIVKNFNRNYIGVHSNLEYVNKYSEVSGWVNFTQAHFVEVKQHIAPNVTGEIDLESARAFDYLCFKFSSTRFNPNPEFKKTAKTIYALSAYLINVKGHISEVANHKDTLAYVCTDDFINHSTVSRVDAIRKEIRELMRYIDPKDFKPIISDFDDEISTFTDAPEEDVDFHVTIDDFKTLEEKTLFFIQTHTSNDLVHQITNIVRPTKEAIKAFKSEIVKIAKTAEEYNDLFKDDNDIIIFIRKNLEMNPLAVDLFISEEKSNGFNDMQLNYAKELLLFISQNGKFERSDLLREELNFYSIFNNIEINKLITDIEKRM